MQRIQIQRTINASNIEAIAVGRKKMSLTQLKQSSSAGQMREKKDRRIPEIITHRGRMCAPAGSEERKKEENDTGERHSDDDERIRRTKKSRGIAYRWFPSSLARSLAHPPPAAFFLRLARASIIVLEPCPTRAALHFCIPLSLFSFIQNEGIANEYVCQEIVRSFALSLVHTAPSSAPSRRPEIYMYTYIYPRVSQSQRERQRERERESAHARASFLLGKNAGTAGRLNRGYRRWLRRCPRERTRGREERDKKRASEREEEHSDSSDRSQSAIVSYTLARERSQQPQLSRPRESERESRRRETDFAWVAPRPVDHRGICSSIKLITIALELFDLSSRARTFFWGGSSARSRYSSHFPCLHNRDSSSAPFLMIPPLWLVHIHIYIHTCRRSPLYDIYIVGIFLSTYTFCL